MNKKIIKRILIIIILFMIFVVAYKLVNTYALFYSEGNGVIEQKNATWRIYVNNQNITSKNSNKFTVDTFNLEENSHVAPGKIAPNTTGSFNLLIDPKNTDVSVKYSVKLDKTKLINDRIKIVSVQETTGNTSLIMTDEDTYTGVMKLEEIKAGKTNNIKVIITWENDESNNKMDTAVGTVNNYKISIPIEFIATQYLGEEIKEYIP